jgi:hypothetical protein
MYSCMLKVIIVWKCVVIPDILTKNVIFIVYHTLSITAHLVWPLDRLCDLVGRVPGYRSSGPRFDSQRYQIF